MNLECRTLNTFFVWFFFLRFSITCKKRGGDRGISLFPHHRVMVLFMFNWFSKCEVIRDIPSKCAHRGGVAIKLKSGGGISDKWGSWRRGGTKINKSVGREYNNSGQATISVVHVSWSKLVTFLIL